MADTCTAHEHIVERLNEFRDWSNQRDAEQETVIQGVSARMDDLKHDFYELKQKVEKIETELPNTITAKITAYIDSLIVTAVKTFSRWFLRSVIGGAIILLITMLIRSLWGA